MKSLGRGKALACLCTKMGVSMKVTGLRTREMDADMRYSQMAIHTKATTRQEEQTERESTLGRTEKCTTANGSKA